MTFYMTANVSMPLNKGDFYEAHTAFRLSLVHLIHPTVLAVQTYNLSSKLATQTYQLRYPLQERHFPTSLRHAEKQPFY